MTPSYIMLICLKNAKSLTGSCNTNGYKVEIMTTKCINIDNKIIKMDRQWEKLY